MEGDHPWKLYCCWFHCVFFGTVSRSVADVASFYRSQQRHGAGGDGPSRDGDGVGLVAGFFLVASLVMCPTVDTPTHCPRTYETRSSFHVEDGTFMERNGPL